MREYDSKQKTLEYLGLADAIPNRQVGEAMLVERLPTSALRVLDLGCGDGRLLDIVICGRSVVSGVAVDVSPAMLEHARARFAGTPQVDVIEHDLARPLPEEWGSFDAIVSSFAIHHLEHARKRELYAEIYAALNPEGLFCNLEHVASPTDELHKRFLVALRAKEDVTNHLLDVATQLRWLRELGFEEVDLDWKWLELALFAGRKPVFS
jgi:tRNA (cmo5U34)-methyltransferase